MWKKSAVSTKYLSDIHRLNNWLSIVISLFKKFPMRILVIATSSFVVCAVDLALGKVNFGNHRYA